LGKYRIHPLNRNCISFPLKLLQYSNQPVLAISIMTADRIFEDFGAEPLIPHPITSKQYLSNPQINGKLKKVKRQTCFKAPHVFGACSAPPSFFQKIAKKLICKKFLLGLSKKAYRKGVLR